jgi:hypothetical protein
MESTVSGYVRRHHLGLVAIFIALAGTAWAADKVGPRDIGKNAVRAKHVKNGKIGTADVADGTTNRGLTGVDVVPDSLGGEDVQEQSLFNDNSLDAADVAEGTLYNDNSLTAADIAGDAVGGSEIAGDAVGSSEITDSAVGSGEVADNTISSDDIVNSGSVEASLVGDLSAGSVPTLGDNKARMLVNDGIFGVTEVFTNGSSAAFLVNTDADESTLFTDVEVDNGYIELDQIADPPDPLSANARIYLRNTPAGSELVVEWPDGSEQILADD